MKKLLSIEIVKLKLSFNIEINPALLINLSNKDEEIFVGRGSFAVIKLQLFRGLKSGSERITT